MIMNMLTGAHAPLIPLITALHDEAASKEYDVPRIIQKLNAVLAYKTENWVENMVIDMVVDFFEKLPEDVMLNVSQNIELHDALPLRFCLYLMDRNHKIAERVIETTDMLDTTDLIYRIQSGEMHEMIAVARRKNLSLEILNALIESKEPKVYLELLKNPCLQIQSDVIRHLSYVAHSSPKVAWYMVTQNAFEAPVGIQAAR